MKEDMKEGRMQRGGLCGGSGLTETARGREDRSRTFSLVPLDCRTSLQDSSAVISCWEAHEPDVCLFQ